MDNVNDVAFICITVALGMMLPLIDKKARQIIIFMIVGVSCCMLVSEINNLILIANGNNMVYVTTTLTPISEEYIKAIPLLYYAVMVNDDKRTLTSSAYAVGVGFALLENMIVLMQNISGATIVWALVRSFGSGLMHGLCTVMVGYGISYVKKKRKLFWCGFFALMSLAITYHGVYNILVQSEYRMAGILLPIVTYIPIVIFMRKEIQRKKAMEEKA